MTNPLIQAVPGTIYEIKATADQTRIYASTTYTDPNTFITEYGRYYDVADFAAQPRVLSAMNPDQATSFTPTLGTEVAMVSTYAQKAVVQLNTFNGPAWKIAENYQANEARSPIRMEVDGAGFAYVLYFAKTNLTPDQNIIRLVRLTPDGSELWSYDFNVSNATFALGGDGLPVVSHTIGDGVLRLTKLGATGGVMWESSATLMQVSIRDIEINNQNEIAVQAQAPWFLNTQDVVTYRFSPSGALRWRRIYHGDDTDFARGLVITNANYVVAAVGTSGTTRSGRSVTYDPDGNIVGVRENAPGTYQNSSRALLTGGLVVVAHLFRLMDNNYQFVLERFNPVTGQLIQSSALTGNTNAPSWDIGTSPAGTVYLAQQAGTTRGLVQYNSSGAQAWVRTLPSGVGAILDVITDVQNSVYVTAREDYAEGADTKNGWYIVKYNTLGTLLWQQRIRTTTAELNSTPVQMQMGKNFALMAVGRHTTATQGPTIAIASFAQPVPPSVVGENYTIGRNQTLTVNSPGVLANDSDLNGDPITAAIVSNPLQGTLSLQSTGAFTYVAPANTGTFSFKYRVSDNTGRSTIAQANITVN
jgi:hypothetical protein